jgi:hypothetical protein
MPKKRSRIQENQNPQEKRWKCTGALQNTGKDNLSLTPQRELRGDAAEAMVDVNETRRRGELPGATYCRLVQQASARDWTNRGRQNGQKLHIPVIENNALTYF